MSNAASDPLADGRIYAGCCLRGMAGMVPQSVDLVLLDLPSGVTRHAWDKTVHLGSLWRQLRRVCKPAAPIVFVAVEPYTSEIVLSNPRWFRYSMVWRKNKATGFLNARRQPLRIHEDVVVFYQRQPRYAPQMTDGHAPGHAIKQKLSTTRAYGKMPKPRSYGGSTQRYPTSVLEIPVVNGDDPRRAHSSQKPEALAEYFIRTYTQPGDLVLDPTAGSGSFLQAAARLGRRWIGFEIDAAAARRADAEVLLASFQEEKPADYREPDFEEVTGGIGHALRTGHPVDWPGFDLHRRVELLRQGGIEVTPRNSGPDSIQIAVAYFRDGRRIPLFLESPDRKESNL